MPSLFPASHDDSKARTLAALIARLGADAVASRQAEVRAQMAREEALRSASTLPPGPVDFQARRFARRPGR